MLIIVLRCAVDGTVLICVLWLLVCNAVLQLKVLCEGVVETVGRIRVGDWSTPFTAHPKLDATTGNLLQFQHGRILLGFASCFRALPAV